MRENRKGKWREWQNLLSIQDEAHDSISISRNNIGCPDVLAVKKNAVLNKEKKHGSRVISEKKNIGWLIDR